MIRFKLGERLPDFEVEGEDGRVLVVRGGFVRQMKTEQRPYMRSTRPEASDLELTIAFDYAEQVTDAWPRDMGVPIAACPRCGTSARAINAGGLGQLYHCGSCDHAFRVYGADEEPTSRPTQRSSAESSTWAGDGTDAGPRSVAFDYGADVRRSVKERVGDIFVGVDEEVAYRRRPPKRPPESRSKPKTGKCRRCGNVGPVGSTCPCAAREREERRQQAERDQRLREAQESARRSRRAGTRPPHVNFADFFRTVMGHDFGFDFAPPAPALDWLGVLQNPTDLATAEAVYKRLAKERHPDVPGGSNEAMAELNAAIVAARAHWRRR